jgi:hypothetical protein
MTFLKESIPSYLVGLGLLVLVRQRWTDGGWSSGIIRSRNSGALRPSAQTTAQPDLIWCFPPSAGPPPKRHVRCDLANQLPKYNLIRNSQASASVPLASLLYLFPSHRTGACKSLARTNHSTPTLRPSFWGNYTCDNFETSVLTVSPSLLPRPVV